jgi:hypothetical protein
MTLPWTGAAAGLASRILRFIETSLDGPPAEPFEALALDIHRWQADHDPVLASLVSGFIGRWTDIPAVPVALFKDLPVGTVDPRDAAVVFRTSGTTGGGRGEHRLRSSALYDAGSIGWARRALPVFPRRVVALLEDPARTSDSSLSHMMALFAAEASWHVRDGVLDVDRLRASIPGSPAFLATTAFAAAEALDADLPPLPPGSLVMVTGGFKGRSVRLDDASLYAAIRERWRPDHLVTEYGMTELSSQLWGAPGDAFAPPPYLRAVAVAPDGAPLPEGSRGQLRFYDLCNLDGTVGVETMDEGIVHADGRVSLIGRLQDAPARGCSLTVEEAWARRGGRP